MSSYYEDEVIRQQNEIIRQQNETTRQQNEKIRQQNEISRLQNEQERIEYYNQRKEEINSINEQLDNITNTYVKEITTTQLNFSDNSIDNFNKLIRYYGIRNIASSYYSTNKYYNS